MKRKSNQQKTVRKCPHFIFKHSASCFFLWTESFDRVYFVHSVNAKSMQMLPLSLTLLSHQSAPALIPAECGPSNQVLICTSVGFLKVYWLQRYSRFTPVWIGLEFSIFYLFGESYSMKTGLKHRKTNKKYNCLLCKAICILKVTTCLSICF